MSLFGGKSLFGASAASTTPQTAPTGGLFGNATAQQQQQQQQPAAGGLFAPKPTTSLFGASTNTQAAGQTGGLFGASTNTQATGQTGGLFGASTNTQQTAGQTGGLFGAPTNTQQAAGQTSSLFGNTISKPAVGQPGQLSSLWGNTSTQQSAGVASGFGSTLPTSLGLSSLGGSTAVNSSATNLTGANESQAQTGAYFDSLLAMTKKQSEGDGANSDLPNLQLGLGDLRSRLKKLGSRGVDRGGEGKAHYILAASGVDPGMAAKDLGALTSHAKAEKSSSDVGTPEVDVESYLANLQTKTTLGMISDSLERSARDFDNFLEDNMALEWESQRKRIYDHFGIKQREDAAPLGLNTPARESQAGFGRSRRSKGPGGATPRPGKSTILGNSNLQRSVIGTPGRIGMHQSEFSDVERPAEPTPQKSASADDRSMRERQSRFAEKIRNLNVARLSESPYPLLSHLAEVQQRSPDPHANHVVEAYRAMVEIVGENPEAESTINGATTTERQFASSYLDDGANAAAAIGLRKTILKGANAFLEKQFFREMETLITKHPHEANLGGRPDAVSKVRAYVRLRGVRKDLCTNADDLQFVNSDPIWAVVFFLLRSGHVLEAAKFVNDNLGSFRGIDRTFSTYLNGYASSEDRRLKRQLQERCASEYAQRSRSSEISVDPFRMACYKIIGRCEVNNRSFEGINTDIQDWIWLQFNLAREVDRSSEMASETYGLAELQHSIKEIGAKHFPKSAAEDTNGSFGMYFYMLALSGQFEDAVAYLYSFSYVDAVHFALGLEYYGLLRPSDPLTADNELRSTSTKGAAQINFARMMGYYTRDFRAADVESAVDYLALICLNRDLSGEAGRRHSNICHEALRELVLETREFSRLIGDIRSDGHRIQGIIELRGPLIGLSEEDDFVNTVTLQAASFADEAGRTTDSVLLYHLAGEYDTVIAIVSRALSEAIAIEIGEDSMKLIPVRPRLAPKTNGQQEGGSLSLAAIDDPVELARTMMTMYERDAMFHRKIEDHNRIACRILLEMSDIKGLVEAGQWAQCLDRIRGLDILPLDAAGDPSRIRNYAARFTGLPNPVAINVPNLLMWTVHCCIRQRDALLRGEFTGNEGTRQMMADQLRQMTLDLTTYTSQLRYRFPPSLHEALARAAAE